MLYGEEYTVADEVMNGFWTRPKVCKTLGDYLPRSLGV